VTNGIEVRVIIVPAQFGNAGLADWRLLFAKDRPVGIHREHPLEVGKHQFLMLLFVVETQDDQGCQLNKIPFEAIRHQTIQH